MFFRQGSVLEGIWVASGRLRNSEDVEEITGRFDRGGSGAMRESHVAGGVRPTEESTAAATAAAAVPAAIRFGHYQVLK